MLICFQSISKLFKSYSAICSRDYPEINMDDSSLSKPYSFADYAVSLANNPMFSDISFLVGPHKTKIYGHKNLMAIGSPVFRNMFFGSLKETSDQITIPDISSQGFVQMQRYIYGMPVDQIPITRLYETFIAGDKYMVFNLNDRLIEFVKEILDESNCCILYNELIKIGEHEELIEEARRLIRSRTKAAFNDWRFECIERDTLIDILNFEWLEMDEVQILESCLRWAEDEIESLELCNNAKNRRKVFADIKPNIRFSDIRPDQLATLKGIDSFLPIEEVGSMLLYLFNKSTKLSPIHCKTARKSKRALTVTNQDTHVLAAAYTAAELTTLLNVNRKVLIEKIYTTLGKDIINELTLSVYEGDAKLELEHQKLCDEAGIWFFQFDKLLDLNSEHDYKLVFKFAPVQFNVKSERLSNTPKLAIGEGGETFAFTINFDAFHCIKQIDFFGLV